MLGENGIFIRIRDYFARYTNQRSFGVFLFYNTMHGLQIGNAFIYFVGVISIPVIIFSIYAGCLVKQESEFEDMLQPDNVLSPLGNIEKVAMWYDEGIKFGYEKISKEKQITLEEYMQIRPIAHAVKFAEHLRSLLSYLKKNQNLWATEPF